MLSKPLVYQEFLFHQKLAPYETDLLRSAVLQITKNNDNLYHNHLQDGFIYRYPLIQYKSILGHAAILYLGEAIKSINKLFANQSQEIKIEDRTFDFGIKKIHAQLYQLQMLNPGKTYDIINWLPLQDDNFKQYRLLKTEEEKINFLKRILIANILAFAKAVDWQIEEEINIENFKIYKQKWISFKDQKFLGFNVRFTTNLFLPPHIGLGKGAAHNYGVIFPVKKMQVK